MIQNKFIYFLKYILISIIVFLTTYLNAQGYNEPYRPQFHFTAKNSWIGDPCGLTKFQGKYHFFWWGHAISYDLVHWKELGWPMLGGTGFSYFTGSIVVDKNNTGGFNTRGIIPMVAIYTSAQTNGIQNQSISYCNSDSIYYNRFQYYVGNPVLDINSNSFRDPDVIWYAPTQCWIMSVVLADERRVSFYSSKDLKNWDYLSSFGPFAAKQEIWEVPSLIQLPVDGDYNNMKWVLIVGMGPNKTQYFVGNFDGAFFTLDNLYRSYINDGNGIEGNLFDSFENNYNNWELQGDAFGTMPSKGTLSGQMNVTGFIGKRLINSFNGGDISTGKLISQKFIIEKNNINFLIAGGKDINKTCIRLVVDDNVVRSATGDNTEVLKWNGWNVSDLIGKVAQIEIMDESTEAWGHILIDYIIFSDILINTGLEHALWGDRGPDFYAARPYRDYDDSNSQPLWQAWMNNWEYATVLPTSPWKGVQSMTRELYLTFSNAGYVIRQKPFRGLLSLRKDSTTINNVLIEEQQKFSLFKPTKNVYEAEFTFDLDQKAKQEFGINLCASGTERIILSYNSLTNNVTFDRTQCGNVSFSDKFPKIITIPLDKQLNQLKFKVFVDQSTIEIFINEGEAVISSLIFPSLNATNIELFSLAGENYLLEFKCWELNSIWQEVSNNYLAPNEKNDIILYINKDGKITIESNVKFLQKKLLISIVDMQGKLIFRQNLFLEKQKISLDNKFNRGLYLVNLNLENNCSLTKKVMIM